MAGFYSERRLRDAVVWLTLVSKGDATNESNTQRLRRDGRSINFLLRQSTFPHGIFEKRNAGPIVGSYQRCNLTLPISHAGLLALPKTGVAGGKQKFKSLVEGVSRGWNGRKVFPAAGDHPRFKLYGLRISAEMARSSLRHIR